MNRLVGIGEYVISDNCEDRIKTYALASCVAVTLYSPIQRVLGMVHIALPSSEVDKAKSTLCPGYFADTGIPLLVNKICRDYGCKRSELVAGVFGGALSPHKDDIFNIGKRNIEEVEFILRSMRIPCREIETGGSCSRTIEAEVSTGTVKMNTQPMMKISKENRNVRQ